jgi:hypothetical protein
MLFELAAHFSKALEDGVDWKQRKSLKSVDYQVPET